MMVAVHQHWERYQRAHQQSDHQSPAPVGLPEQPSDEQKSRVENPQKRREVGIPEEARPDSGLYPEGHPVGAAGLHQRYEGQGADQGPEDSPHPQAALVDRPSGDTESQSRPAGRSGR
jgi:hypothetical protein